MLAAVYGPAEVKASREKWDRAVVEVVVKPAQGQGGLKERRLEQLLAGCCECCLLSSFSPHTAVSIVLQVKTAQGLLLSTLCLALCLAMVDAGLPLSSPFSSHSTSFTPDGDPHNPTLVQEESQCVVTVVTDCKSGHVIATHTEGACSVQQLQTAMAHAEKAGENMFQFYRQAVQRRLSKDAKFAHLNIAF